MSHYFLEVKYLYLKASHLDVLGSLDVRQPLQLVLDLVARLQEAELMIK